MASETFTNRVYRDLESLLVQDTGQSPAVVPPPPPGMLATRAAPTNTLAVVSLIAGIGSFLAHVIPFVGGLTAAIVAVVTGHIARGQIRSTGEQGAGIALAGMILGYIHLGLIVLLTIFVIVVIVLFGGLAALLAATSSH